MRFKQNTAVVAMLSAALASVGCATGPVSNLPTSGTSTNYAAGSLLGGELSRSDQAGLARVFEQAVSAGAIGERFDWSGSESFGWVMAGAKVLGDLKPMPASWPEYPAGLHLDESFETEQGLHALTRNANARLGPSTDFPVNQTLEAGVGIVAVGKTVGKPWILAEVDGRIVGYIHESLAIKAPGTELDLAGGPRRRPLECRRWEQRISVRGRSDRWEGVACAAGGRWKLIETGPSTTES